MKAAVVHAPGSAPHFEVFPEPVPADGEVLATVLAAGLHPLVRAQAAGTHYSSHGRYPLIPGIDGVVELPDGRRGYTGWLRAPYGTFAERAAVHPQRMLELSAGLAPELVAGIMNPASSSWLALRLRAKFQAGESVLVLGATGASGGLAVQIARALGAKRIIAAGRNTEILDRLGADAVLPIDAGFREAVAQEVATHGVDVVLDYLWGEPATATFAALLAGRDRLGTRRVRYINLGEMAGAAQVPPHALRSLNLEVSGSGSGSVAPPEMAMQMPALLAEVARGALTIELAPTPLSDIERAWTAAEPRRIVITG